MGIKRRGGRRYSCLCSDLYLLALEGVDGDGPRRGWLWEQMIAARLVERGYPARAIAGGVSIFGVTPASGLRHQVDAEIRCVDALVIGEWKAYRGPVPKNEVLRFKGITDDIFEGMHGRPPTAPLLRLFGVAGDASTELRWYAARHGITLIEQTRWPAPVLADPYLRWPIGAEPSACEIERVRWLSRPMQEAYPAAEGGGYIVPPLPAPSTVEAMLRSQDALSEKLWRLIDADPSGEELGMVA